MLIRVRENLSELVISSTYSISKRQIPITSLELYRYINLRVDKTWNRSIIVLIRRNKTSRNVGKGRKGCIGFVRQYSIFSRFRLQTQGSGYCHASKETHLASSKQIKLWFLTIRMILCETYSYRYACKCSNVTQFLSLGSNL